MVGAGSARSDKTMEGVGEFKQGGDDIEAARVSPNDLCFDSKASSLLLLLHSVETGEGGSSAEICFSWEVHITEDIEE
jgi:hypothetical protein